VWHFFSSLDRLPQRVDAFGTALNPDSPVQVLQPVTASCGVRADGSGGIPATPIPTALLLITTESVPVGTTRSEPDEISSGRAGLLPHGRGLEAEAHP